ncbi:MAG: chloride channel protein [Caldilineaceae bacterium]
MMGRLWSRWRNEELSGQLRAQQATNRAKRRALGVHMYQGLNELFAFHFIDFVYFLKIALKWTVLGGVAGILAGTASWIFLTSLAWATATRLANPALLYALPLAGLAVGWLYYRFGGNAALGNNLVIDEVNSNRSKIPLRMAPFVLLGTIVTHLFGGSAGREGTAIQMGASLADGVRRVLGLTGEDRRLLLMAGISGGFGSVFGVPAAGFVFGMEVQSMGRIRYEGIIPCLAAAFIGDLVTRAWGTPHAHYPQLPETAMDLLLLSKVALAGIAFGLTSMLFVELTHAIKQIMIRITTWKPLYPVIGGVMVIGLTWLVGTRDYLGLSLPLITASVTGENVLPWAFAIKLLFTAVTLGTGYLGGEVTPLFVIGATLGSALAGLFGLPPALLASIGMVAVFAGASNTPLACAIMGIELFGGGAAPYLFAGCVVAYLASGHRGIYVTQQVVHPKTKLDDLQPDDNLKSLQERRKGGWLPALPAFTGTLEQKSVRTIMTAPAIYAREDASLEETIAQALRAGVRAVPVLNAASQVIGIVTDNDLERAGIKTNLHLLQQMDAKERVPWLAQAKHIGVQQVMSQPVITVSHQATVATALQLLRQHHLKRLPVVDQAGHLIGLLTRSDLLRQLMFEQAETDKQTTFFDWSVRVDEVELEPAVTVAASMPLQELLPLLQRALQVRAVVVNDAGQAIGMISESDLLSRIEQRQRVTILTALRNQGEVEPLHLSQTVGDLMTTPVITVNAESRAFDAIRLLIDNQIKRLPVVDHDGKVLGLVNRRALLYGLLREQVVQ